MPGTIRSGRVRVSLPLLLSYLRIDGHQWHSNAARLVQKRDHFDVEIPLIGPAMPLNDKAEDPPLVDVVLRKADDGVTRVQSVVRSEEK